ncbi:MAG: nucleotidyltransferase domain-containing protein [Anaerolineae bacterium]|nr:nucleotidyltransferase domain-containing protein [Anaerolineae bacterium]
MTEAVITPIPVPMEAIRAYCQKWQVRELALFGSILRADFSAESDVDVLVEFQEGRRYTLADLVQMGDELEALFGRKADLIDRSAVEASRNYLRRRSILDSARVIYAE